VLLVPGAAVRFAVANTAPEHRADHRWSRSIVTKVGSATASYYSVSASSWSSSTSRARSSRIGGSFGSRETHAAFSECSTTSQVSMNAALRRSAERQFGIGRQRLSPSACANPRRAPRRTRTVVLGARLFLPADH
jgi:hypothetical protein